MTRVPGNGRFTKIRGPPKQTLIYYDPYEKAPNFWKPPTVSAGVFFQTGGRLGFWGDMTLSTKSPAWPCRRWGGFPMGPRASQKVPELKTTFTKEDP